MQFTIFNVFDFFGKLIKLPTKISSKYCDSSYSKFSLFTLPYRPIKFKRRQRVQGSRQPQPKILPFFHKTATRATEKTGKYTTSRKCVKGLFLKEAKKFVWTHWRGPLLSILIVRSLITHHKNHGIHQVRKWYIILSEFYFLLQLFPFWSKSSKQFISCNAFNIHYLVAAPLFKKWHFWLKL